MLQKNMKVNPFVCGWVANSIHKGKIIGWLLDPTSKSPRDALVSINGYIIEVRCNQKREAPKRYKEHVNNGFFILVDKALLPHLRSTNEIILIDKITKQEVAKSVINIDLDFFRLSINCEVNNIYPPPKKAISLKCITGKLNSKFSNFKISGWLTQSYNESRNNREVLIKLENNINLFAFANITQSNTTINEPNGPKFVFEIIVPVEVALNLPANFEVSLWDKETNTLIDKKNYKNFQFFTPNNFDEYLKYSMINPIVYAPFSEKHKRCFAFMENIATRLEQHTCSCLVSIIMPAFNRANVILDSIKSVLSQSYQNYELIIIDDGSSDGTAEVIKSIDDPRIRLVVNKQNFGCSYSRNLGVKKSKGRYIFYLDSDNIWDSRYLKVMLGAFTIHPDASAIYCGQYLFKENNLQCYAVRFASFNRSLLENRNYIDLNCFAHTREAFDAVGGFNTELKRLIDYDYILRISNKFDIYSVPVLLSNYYYSKIKTTITETERYKPLIITKYIYDKIGVQNNDKLNVSAIIPNYENIDDLEKCVESLIVNNCSEIIVVDNNSSIDCQQRLEKLNRQGKIKLIINSYNYGYSYAVNQGIHKANINNDLLLVNNDSFYATNALYYMRQAAYSLPKVGLIVPRQILYAKHKSINAHVPFANENENCDVNLSMIHKNIDHIPLFSNCKHVELNYAPFFSVYIKRDVYNIAGDLDAQHGRHYRSDKIYCDVIRHVLNLKIYYVYDAIVFHGFQKSTNIFKQITPHESEQMIKNNVWSAEDCLKEGYVKKLWQ